jgi:hypothetical protein
MVTYKQMESILLKDGKKYLVNMQEWARQTLTGSDLAEYQTDALSMDPFYQNLKDTGVLTLEPITELINTGHGNIIIQVGMLHIWQDHRLSHTKYELWQSRFASDPNVTYHPEILQT